MDTESVAILALLLPHMLGAAFLAWRLMPASAREELRGWFREDDGGTPPPTPTRPRRDGGGAAPPLPDATPAGVRLREPGRLADRVPAPARRPAHPAPPERAPEPQRR